MDVKTQIQTTDFNPVDGRSCEDAVMTLICLEEEVYGLNVPEEISRYNKFVEELLDEFQTRRESQ
ncbi:hypothetical protein KAR91_27485 [Candidatus Pacearchaeota archaeon]|nr:hypothetical protein [Candidatus Pacearchaeota archaeon]